MDKLVSAQWLGDHLSDSDLRIIDASSHLPMAERDAAAEFVSGHIPGARFLDLSSFYDPDSCVPSALPCDSQFTERMARMGIGPDTRVVIYDDSAVKTSARAWFILRLHGAQQVAILDGGLGKWKAEGRPLESGASAEGGGTLVAASGPTTNVRSKADMLTNIASPAEQVLDARDCQRFSGETEDFRPEVASGHIPGSCNLPFDQVLNADGTYKDASALRSAFTGAGIALDQPVVTTCGSGVTASVLLFALHLIGVENGAVYDGSWSEWGTDPDTPKAMGAAS